MGALTNGMRGIRLRFLKRECTGVVGGVVGGIGGVGVPAPLSAPSLPLDTTRYYLLGQLEYYLSPQNMAQDFYLRKQVGFLFLFFSSFFIFIFVFLILRY
jgi:hypothetical protein